MKVLVCGGRTFGRGRGELAKVYTTLAEIHRVTPITELIQGGSEGADQAAKVWATLNGVPGRTYRADWARDGRAAGPIRNTRMLTEGTPPNLVVAFPGGWGTADMVAKAKAKGIEVREIEA